MTAVFEIFDPPEPCRLCGCTDDMACPGGCWWIAEGICSSHDLAEAMTVPAAAVAEIFDPPASHDFAACCAGLPLFRWVVGAGDAARWRRLLDIGMAPCPLCCRTLDRPVAVAGDAA